MELFGIVGASNTDRIGEIQSAATRLEIVFEDSTLHLLGNPNDPWYSRYSSDDFEVFLVGNVFSWRNDSDQYHTTTTTPDATVVHELLKQEGIAGFSCLNGEFFAIVYDYETRYIHIATDRLGAVPAVAHQSDGTTVVTTNIQLLAEDPESDLAYDKVGLSEYFAFQRTYGTKTLIAGVRRFHPGSVETYEGGSITSRQRYWLPQRNPQPRSFEAFVEEFVDRFTDVIAERTRGDDRFGLLLSGGSDSRLLAHYLPSDTIAYHMNDRINREARVSKQIAQEESLEFRFLKRHPEYYYDVLHKDAHRDNYTSWFHEAHTRGFEDEFEDVDVIVTGLFADILFGGYYLPKYAMHIPGPDWLAELPIFRDIKTEDELIQYRLDRAAFNRDLPSYLTIDVDLKNILQENIRSNENYVVDHGIKYPSIAEAKFSFIPLTNDFARDYFSMSRLGQRWSPFLDMRLIDLQLATPIRHMTKHNVVNKAVTREAPHLGRIAHSDSGLDLRYPESIHLIGDQFRRLREAIFQNERSEEIPYATNESWPDHDTLLKEVDVYQDFLQSDEIRTHLHKLPFLDVETLDKTLLQSPSHATVYPLITILATPLSREINDIK